jgi:hypothetical protein
VDFSTTAALRASEALLVELIETREAAKVQNYLQGKAMLENALKNAALSEAEKRTVQQQAQIKGIGAALGLLGGLLQAARERYRAMDAKIERMEAEEERRWQQGHTPARPAFDMAKWKQQDYAESARWEQQQAYQRYRQGEWADPQPPKTPTPTATPTPVKPPTPPPTPPMPQGTPTPTATPALMKTPLPVPAPAPPIPQRTPTATPASAPRESKPWWQPVRDWLQDKVEKFVYHPPAWLSVSYSSGEFSLGNYTAAHWISYQPSARNFWESISYQQVSVELKTKGALTTNPKGVVDVDLSDGTITFNTGPNSSFFIQPSALSIG